MFDPQLPSWVPTSVEPGQAPGGLVNRLYVDGELRAEHALSMALAQAMAIGDGEVAGDAMARGAEVVNAFYDGDTGKQVTVIVSQERMA